MLFIFAGFMLFNFMTNLGPNGADENAAQSCRTHDAVLLSLRSCRHIVAVVNPEILMVAAKVLSVVLTGLAVELILTGITQFEPIAAALKRAGSRLPAPANRH